MYAPNVFFYFFVLHHDDDTIENFIKIKYIQYAYSRSSRVRLSWFCCDMLLLQFYVTQNSHQLVPSQIAVVSSRIARYLTPRDFLDLLAERMTLRRKLWMQARHGVGGALVENGCSLLVDSPRGSLPPSFWTYFVLFVWGWGCV